ncbi:hypothetical protein ACRAWF_19715 [Streptomyces sp. L7]
MHVHAVVAEPRTARIAPATTLANTTSVQPVKAMSSRYLATRQAEE